MGLISVSVLVPLLHAGTNGPLLIAAVLPTALTMFGIGIPIALHFKTVTAYLIGSAGLLIPIVGPAFIALWTDMPIWLAIVPPIAQLRLILVATGAMEAGLWEITFMFAVSSVAAGIAVAYGIKRLKKEMGRQ